MEITSLVVVALQITTRDAMDSALVAEKVIKKITRSLRSLDDFFRYLLSRVRLTFMNSYYI